ncbi:MAG: hypothetical protein H0V93_12430 [Euzebyales bacterium]|nr:hypothetical protein [Euzebyales bacterium]
MTMPAPLAEGSRCVLAVRGLRGPLAAPMAFWFDGEGLWTTTSGASVKAEVLRRDPTCVAYVPPADPSDPGVVVRGHARVHSLRDPVALALHAPTISAAMTALAARNVGTLLGYAQDAPQIPLRWTPPNRVVVRLAAEEIEEITAPEPGPGIAPALPAQVPAVVRRALAGRRRIALAVDGGRLDVVPAAWGQGYRLTLPVGWGPADGVAACAVVDAEPRRRPTEVLGLALRGIVTDRTLRPERATWWRGFDLATVDVPAPTDPGITLPD